MAEPKKDPYASIAKPLDDPYAAIATAPANPVSGMLGSEITDMPTSDYIKLQGKRLAKGTGEGLLNTVSGASELINKIPFIGEHLAPRAGVDAMHQMAEPETLPESIGRGMEQTGEFMMPGPGEAELAAKSGKIATLGKIAYQAGKTGVMNKLQNGDFTTGALVGGAGEGLAQGAKAIAPKIAESALNIRKTDRAFKEPGAIGRAVLDETTGVRPSTVAESAQKRLNQLNPELEHAADVSTNRASLVPAQDAIGNAAAKATRQGEAGAVSQLQPMASHLQQNRVTGVPHLNTVSTNPTVNQTVTPRQLLDIKRGFGNEFVHNWNPEVLHDVRGTAARGYHALGEEFNNAVPEAGPLNKRIGALVPVAKRAESVELNAPTTQRMFNRIARPTGALVGPLVGGEEGYRHGGAPGAVAGAVAGLAVPELLTSPTGQMILARSANAAPKAVPLLSGSSLQLDRNKKKPTE